MAESNMADSNSTDGETDYFDNSFSQHTGDSGSGRFNRFSNILARCTEKCFYPARLEKISACLPDVRNKNPEGFDSIIQQLTNGLKSNVKQEVELMVKQENLVSLCHELDEITANVQENSEPAWRPTANPSEDIKDHVMKIKVELRDKLKDMLGELQAQNKVIQEDIMSTKTEITNREEKILKYHENLQKVVEVCYSFEERCNDKDLERMMVELDSNSTQ